MRNLHQIFLTFLLGLFTTVSAQQPVLSSLPSAPATIYLDFDGQYLAGTSWNWNGPMNLGPSNLSNDAITEIFNRVAEDYRPFQVNVTTDSAKYNAAPLDRRTRVILTISYEWYGVAGGVAYLNSFTWGDNTPCFVFTSLHNYNVKNIAEAAAHEVGHTLGLRHQSKYDNFCNKTSEYNSGTGSGEIGWAPIMGVGYSRNFTLWNSGANPLGCSNIQNDLEVITTSNGFTYRTDDYGTQFNSATTAQFVNNQFSINGIIERNTDIDLIKFVLPSFGNFKLNAIPFGVGTANSGSNLDVQVDLMTGNNSVLRSYNPADLLNATMDTMLSAGTYWLRVQGMGNEFTSEYASLGSYTLQATFGSGGVLPLQKFLLKGNVFNGWSNLSWDIVSDDNIIKQTVEASTGGKPFEEIGYPSESARSFAHLIAQDGNVYYRIKTLMSNGREYYSNIISLRSAGDGNPKLQTNMISQKLTVSSPAGYDYQVTDMNGRIFQRGRVVKGLNILEASNYSKGIYFIVFNNGEQQYSEKFIRQ
jgi:hypothetical protein